LEHVEGDILLTMPKISELDDPAITDDMLVKNKDIVEQMEEIVMSWEKHIQKASNLASFSFVAFLVICLLLQNTKMRHSKSIYYRSIKI